MERCARVRRHRVDRPAADRAALRRQIGSRAARGDERSPGAIGLRHRPRVLEQSGSVRLKPDPTGSIRIGLAPLAARRRRAGHRVRATHRVRKNACRRTHAGYGRTRAGHTGTGAGFNANALRTSDAPWFGGGLEIAQTGETASLACTQYHHLMEGRAMIRAATRDAYIRDPKAAHEVPGAEEV